MPGSILGTSVVRVEDPDLLIGKSTYIDNLPIEGVLHLVFVRSPIPHGYISNIDVQQALSMDGVVSIFTAADLAIAPHHAYYALNDKCKRPPLATDKVRFVGEAVVAVVATSKVAALDAAEAVIVDYDELPAAIDPEEALSAGAALQFDDVEMNLAAGSRSPLDSNPLSDAEVVIRGRFINQRVAVVPMEGNAIAVVPSPDGLGHDTTVYVSTQMPHFWAELIAAIFEIDQASIRVIAPHVGGAFGGKAGITAEHSAAFAIARLLQRPVKWVETRSENLVAMPHGRGQVQYVEMGFKRDGTITGLKCRMIGDAGAYAGFGGGLVMGSTRSMAQGVYQIPAIEYDVAVALTNTTPMGAFRGAGRPEATAFLERIMDIAADELEIDPVELRLHNLIPAGSFPYSTLMGPTYDSGDYKHALDKVLELSEYAAWRTEQQRRKEENSTLLLGIGVSTYVEVTAGGGGDEYSSVEVHPDGTATIKVGTSGHGQGHPTSFAMIVADQLGIPIEDIHFIQSDTAEVPRGGGTGGSRSLQVGGSSISLAANEVLARAKELAARQLEASEEDIVVSESGGLSVAGVPASALSWSQISELAISEGQPLKYEYDFSQKGATFPFGAHVSIVEVDTETGRVVPIRHFAVDDCGKIVNPLLVQGQQHGGIAQGIAQVLWEHFVYDSYGNPLTSTLAEYGMPSAAELPSLTTSNTETPSPLNPLGAKGIGESGTIGAMPAVHNAVIDAISHFGIRHIDMPCTPEKVWNAIRDAKAGRPPTYWQDPPPIFETLPERNTIPRNAAEDVDV